MNVWGFLSGGVTETIGEVAKEWIQTDMESAEAKSLFVKTLDPNGSMRRDLSRFASVAYGFYLVNTVVMIYLVSFNLGDIAESQKVISMMTDLFTPITASWAAIVSASFGVNGINSSKGK